MMSLTARDKQYFDDNMLTDEDFDFGTIEELAASYEQKVESISNGLQINNQVLQTEENHFQPSNLYAKNFLNDLFNKMYESDFKEEPLSPSTSDMYTSVNEASVVTIPDVSDSFENAILADTPPSTPCGLTDSLPASPINCNGEPVIVSLDSLSGVSYAVPQNTQALITPLNYMSMQPKLESKITKPITIIPKSGSNIEMTTPEKVEKTHNKRIQLRAPPNVPIPVSKLVENLNNQNDHKIFTKASSTKKNSVLSTSEICAAALKRQERIIKNRESAYLSRKRKKEYVAKLETELHQITVENSCLREENSHLKSKILDLEKEILKLKAAFSPNGMKKTACLMIAIFMLTFNFGSYSSILQKAAPIPVKSDLPRQRFGRVLLWDDSNSTVEKKNGSKSIYTKLRSIQNVDESSYVVHFDKTYNSSTCQHFINKTESLRLENDLLGWVERVEKKRKQTKMTKRRFHMEDPLPHLATWSRHRTELNRDLWAKKKNKNEILIYETPRKAYEDFFDAIHRRDDTFYFVSFSGDHLLLPALAHNKTLRPRMSFVMPAMTLNESVEESDNHVSMMQIDCEVMDTKLVHIKESVIPEHLRQKHNYTSKPHSKNSAEYPNYRQTRRLQSINKLPPK